MADVYKDWVRTNASRYADAPALENIETGEKHTWTELDVRVGKLAGALQDRFGVRQGDRVLLIAEGDTRIFELQFACMRLGVILVPLNWRLALPELVALAKDAAPSVVVFDNVWSDTGTKIAELLGVEKTLGWRCASGVIDYDTVLEEAEPVEPRTDLPLDAPSHILHTSGTTGAPKGAITTPKTLIWQTLNTMETALLAGSGNKQLNPMPLFHAGGLCTIATPLLITGGCVATMRRFEPDRVVELLGDPSQGFTHFTAPPVMWLMLTEHQGFADGDFSGLKYAEVAGGVPGSELIRTWKNEGVQLQQAYGGTELGPAVASMPRGSAEDRPGSCGRPVPYTHVRLVNTDGADVADGEVGEIWIKGPSVTPGYWRKDPVEHRTFTDGWFRTGDAARRDGDGFLYLVDRYKDMYKSGGENISPAEVERVLITHPAITDAAVIGVPDEKWGEVGRAFVVTAPGTTVTLEELREHCFEQIARYKAPRALVVVESLPRNTTGKIQKNKLRRMHA
ncbi:acyl-CoA synthetase [Mycobacterium tuberculosis]|nr:acyl-CoA synthetase [Mycobacterium tuberculosis]